jgi:undecaprenyl-diphosphatase
MQWDSELFLWLNRDLGETTDWLMVQISSKVLAIPLYIFLAWKIYQKTAKLFWKFLLGVILMIFVSDQTSVAIKNLVQRPRPCHEVSLEGQVHQVNGKCGGSYGFYSSHASNTMAISALCILAIGTGWISVLLLLWVALVGYSRIYLGVHYPGDILTGWVAGALIAFTTFKLMQHFIPLKTKID